MFEEETRLEGIATGGQDQQKLLIRKFEEETRLEGIATMPFPISSYIFSCLKKRPD